jgi:hypothetical protein
MSLVVPDKIIRGAEYHQYDGCIIKREAVKSPGDMGSDMAQMSIQPDFELVP